MGRRTGLVPRPVWQTLITHVRKRRYAEITPFFIPQTQNFQVGLYWPTAVAVTIAGRIGVVLDGFYYRQSQ